MELACRSDRLKRHPFLLCSIRRMAREPMTVSHQKTLNASNKTGTSPHLTPVTSFIGVYFCFSTHRCHPGRRAARRDALFLMALVQILMLQQERFDTGRIICQISTVLCGLVVEIRSYYVAKEKHIVYKQRKHTTTRKEGGRKVLVKSPLTQCQPRHDELCVLPINKTAQTLLDNPF